jgi:hypothetical protein
VRRLRHECGWQVCVIYGISDEASALPHQVAASWPAERLLPAIEDVPPAKALDQALLGIEARYGMRTADVVAMQLEYPRHSAPQ